MRCNTLESLIPIPESVQKSGGQLFFRNLKSYCCASLCATEAAEEMQKAFSILRSSLTRTEEEVEAQIVFLYCADRKSEEWEIRISPKKIQLLAGTKRGFLYACSAFLQMTFAALREGPSCAFYDCGTVSDSPRFVWRSFMLDSARHFQTPLTIKRIIRLLAFFRINTFHWHLTDDQGWRLASELVPGIVGPGSRDHGSFSPDDVRDIAACAKYYGIEIVPEIDIPGHSGTILSAFPEYSCDGKGGEEFCLGNPKSLTFLKAIFDELLDVFPDSNYIHMGGDEAETKKWEKCPLCRKAMENKGLYSMRELENDFMVEMTRHVAGKGRTPVLWGTCSGQFYPPETIIQAWLDIREPLRIAANGNKVVYSVHNSLYFDYPMNQAEPLDTWMFELSEKGVYMTEPYILWEKELKNTILGLEACLWTEMVPEWRILEKTLPRLPAYAECAWSQSEKKNYYDFVLRRDYLKSAGYLEFLRLMIG